MKKLNILKCRPLHNYVILTADRVSAEELAELHGGIIPANQVNQLREYQKIIAISPALQGRGLDVGQLVLINIDRYGVSKHKRNSLAQTVDENYDAVVEYRVPTIQINGKEYLRLGDNDIELIVDEYEFKEIKKSPIIQEVTNKLIMPKDKQIILGN